MNKSYLGRRNNRFNLAGKTEKFAIILIISQRWDKNNKSKAHFRQSVLTLQSIGNDGLLFLNKPYKKQIHFATPSDAEITHILPVSNLNMSRASCFT